MTWASDSGAPHLASPPQDNVALAEAVPLKRRSLCLINGKLGVGLKLSFSDVHRIDDRHAAYDVVSLVKQRTEGADLNIRKVVERQVPGFSLKHPAKYRLG